MWLRAYLELTKPRITALVVFTRAAGLWLAPALPPLHVVLITVAGTAMSVAAANVLNMYLERDTDALMPRTMRRPLPSGRIEPHSAVRFGSLLAAVSVPLLLAVLLFDAAQSL
jgi:protoheme IX farnesyltransferase